ncbi:pectinesterase inhibitor domain, Pectin lyase fold/virulence factor [Artemisia annua]|uniref:Pectinesterase n=2 Tax=Artemisia annua TaxID=35608 RepID=A0A2U1LSF6_ARTAN|nr:pectinesterase inhibitor domain, Pectin lyase fold/virulence factor [Artemisia annua]
MANSGYNNNALLILYGFFVLFLSSYVVYGTDSDSITKSLIKSSCTTTLYPDICYSTLSPVTRNLLTKKDVIELTITKTKETIQANLHTINKLMATPNLSTRAKIALNDCLQMVDGTIQQLDTVMQELKAYPNRKSIRHHANDLKTLMSTTITNKETCLDSLSHKDASSKHLRKAIVLGQEYGGKMCSNVLAMIKDMTDKDIANNNNNNFNILNFNSKKEAVMWPEWLSAGDRKLLQSGDVTPNKTVAADGTGDYTSVADAVAAAPSKSTSRYVIKIKAGVYRENVAIPSGKPNLMFIGDGRGNTIITASESVAGGNTTFNSATVAAVGSGFLARDITFQNAAGPSGEQAVALRVGSDLSAFYRCGIIAYQDTLYVHSNRQFFVNCFIAGTVDFIFGNAAVVLQNCDIQPRLPGPKQKNMVTAQGRTDPNQNTGIVIQKCKINATSDLLPVQASYPSYLGRPWKEYSRTVVMQTSISDVIVPAGWYPWDGDFALNTLYYREYQNTGPGADTSNRVTWPGWGVITNTTEAESFTAGNFIDGGNWLSSTGFPSSLGL